MQDLPILQKLRQYVTLSRYTTGNDKAQDENIISAMIDLEEEILIYFGLPSSAYCYTSRMEDSVHFNTDIGQTADELYRWLKNEAITYLCSPTKSNIEILNEGQERMLHANEVIPFTGYTTTSYNSFLYHDIFCRYRCSAADMMAEIKASEHVNEFSAEFSSLPYHAEFVKYKNERRDLAGTYLPDIDFYCSSFSSKYPVDSYLSVASFVVTAFSVHDHHTCIVEAAINYHSRLLRISIWCTLKQLTYILEHSEYLSDTASVLLALRYHNFETGPYLFSSNGRAAVVLNILKINFELERQGRGVDNDDHTCSFIISYIPDYNSIVRY